MTYRILPGIVVAATCLWPPSPLAALSFEVHPGLYQSYEYSDNYEGEVADGQSEATYTVGPSITVTGESQRANLDLSGRYTRSYHRRNEEDDSPEAALSARAAYRLERVGGSLAYSFMRTLTRDTLSSPFGERKVHSGDAEAAWDASQVVTLRAGCDITDERWSGRASDEEDVQSNGLDVGALVRIGPLNTLDVVARRAYVDYEVSRDVVETSGSARLERSFTPRLTGGLVVSYADERLRRPGDRAPLRVIHRGGLVLTVDTERLPDSENRADARITTRYAASDTWTFLAEAGAGRVDAEGVGAESTFAGSAAVEKQLAEDRFALRASKAYTSEFTTSRYGSYDTTSFSLDWERRVSRGLTARSNVVYERRKPVREAAQDEEEERDGSGTVSIEWLPMEHLHLDWRPLERISLTARYTYLRTAYETSGTARENRYGLMAEVRF
ncbi:MAG TPA: hypothetical protein PLS81_10180 [Deltaproteobacteria bacterium]|nr:hypothetical protein [Deltaproteobacteria bacterium]HPP79838.1 hypothetical protein [Deltaproteobacteria bacterium]